MNDTRWTHIKIIRIDGPSSDFSQVPIEARTCATCGQEVSVEHGQRIACVVQEDGPFFMIHPGCVAIEVADFVVDEMA